MEDSQILEALELQMPEKNANAGVYVICKQ
jgi:hypothetical protein